MDKRKLVIVCLVIVGLLIGIVAILWAVHPTKDATKKSGSTNSIRIKEWKVALPLTPAIADAYYTYDAGSDEAFISTKQLDVLLSHIHGCTTGLHGLYYKHAASAASTLTEQHHIEPLCAVPADAETTQIGSIQAAIRAAAQAATTATP